MNRTAPKIDVSFFKMRTYLAKSRIKSTLDLAEKFSTDPDKVARLKEQRCKACFYSTGMAGQAFTEQPCACCGESQTYSSTATDVFCMQCAKEGSVCKKCGSDIELKEGRHKWPQAKEA